MMLSQIPGEIAKILVIKVRVLTADQIARHFFRTMNDPLQCAHRAIRTLNTSDFGSAWQTCATHLEIGSALFRWDPKQNISYSPQQIAWKNSRRWNAVPLKRTICITSTEKSRAYFGGRCRPPRGRELEHDINVAGLYLRLLQRSPVQAASWAHEDSFKTNESVRPDATILDKDGEPIVIDLLGRGYSAKKIAGIIQRHKMSRLRLY